VRALLEELQRRGVSVLLNSHLLSEVELVCDRVTILLGGKVVAAGAPGELARPRGVEIETDDGVATYADARRDDVPRLVEQLVRDGPPRLRRTRTHLHARGGLRRGGRRRDAVTATLTIAGYGLREALRTQGVRRRLRAVDRVRRPVLARARYTFHHLGNVVPPAGIDAHTFAASFLFGMAMFGTLFLGVVLAIFLTLGVVRGDAERGLLQPLVVRPVGRRTCCRTLSSARRPCASRTCWRSTSRRWC
jgi:hypothetical protein